MIPPYSEERAEVLRQLSARLFNFTIVVIPTEEEHRNIEIACRSMHTNPMANRTDKTWELSLETGKRGLLVEMAAKMALGLDHYVKPSIDINDESSYNHDLDFKGKWVEVKSLTPGHENHEVISYSIDGAKTLEKHRESIKAIVFGSLREIVTDVRWDVDFRWIVEPTFFGKPYITKNYDGDYYRFSPLKTHRLRYRDACLWNPRLYPELKHEEPENEIA